MGLLRRGWKRDRVKKRKKMNYSGNQLYYVANNANNETFNHLIYNFDKIINLIDKELKTYAKQGALVVEWEDLHFKTIFNTLELEYCVYFFESDQYSKFLDKICKVLLLNKFSAKIDDKCLVIKFLDK